MNTPENPRLIDSSDIYGTNANGDEVITGSSVRSDITLRDLFAAFSLMGMNAADRQLPLDVLASVAYQDADAMLAERAKGGAK